MKASNFSDAQKAFIIKQGEEGTPVAVIEGGAVYFLRADHIGRPVFATNASGAVVWRAVYDPFGGVHTTTGTPINLRFPGQWFQSESGLHQNWMRDYDPTTGRYSQADPLGLVDGASVYGYARQNPGKWTDPSGEYTIGDALDSLSDRNVSPNGWFGNYSDEQVFDEWLRLERADRGWLAELTPCPCNLYSADASEWGAPGAASQSFHPGGVFELRSKPTPSKHGNQCIYDASGKLITSAPAAGSADRYSPLAYGGLGAIQHFLHDVDTYNGAADLGRVTDYFSVRPVVGEACCSD